MKDIFTKRLLKYNLRNCRITLLPNPKTKNCCKDTIAFKAAQFWSTPPTRYRNLPSLDLFKSEIKKWHCRDRPCNICRIFVDFVGFINWEKLHEVYLSIDKYSDYVWDLSGEYLLWGFSLEKVSNFIWEETLRRLPFEWFLKYLESLV